MTSSIVKSTAQKLGTLLVEEAKYLYKVRDKVEKLQTELEWMECFLRDADTQQHKETIICKWVSQVRDLAYDAEDIIQRYLHEISHHRQSGFRNTLKWFSCIVYTCDAWTLHNLGSEIEDMTVEISELTSRLQRYGIQIIKPTKSLEYSATSREERRTYSHIQEDVVGINKDIQKVVDQILRANVNVVSISGTGGLGKTTLARKVFSNKQIQVRFNKCVWVYISQEFERTRIFQEIFNGLTKDTNASDADLPQKIDELLKKEKCFVVLDDVWTFDAWKRLKPAFESIKSCESKILITTRKQDLIQHVDSSGYDHPLKPLSLEDSWKLLQLKAFIRHGSTVGESSLADQNELQDDDEKDREKLGREMLKHCGGLPLAIVALGGILCNKKTMAEWKDVKQNIASYLMNGEQGDENGRISEVLELSYQDLPFYLKPCFLYLGIFPEDYEISTQRLYHLWDAEGLLVMEGGAKKRGRTSFDVGERYLSELVQRSMVQVEKYGRKGRIKTCRVHDVMRDLCLKKGEEINFLNIVEWSNLDLESVLLNSCCSENKKLRRCALHWKGDDVIESQGSTIINKHATTGEKKATCVRSILVFPALDKGVDYAKWMSRRAWSSFPLLRVLDLQGVEDGGLLDGVENLIHLKLLSLRDTTILELPLGLCYLKCLETLDLRCQTKRVMLPHMLDELQRLRHLYLPEDFVVKDGKELSLPVCLMETLVNYNPWACKSKDLVEMTNLRCFVPFGMLQHGNLLKDVLESPVMKKPGQATNIVPIHITPRILKEDPQILSSLAGPPSCFKLTIDGSETCSNDLGESSIVFVDSLKDVAFRNSVTIGQQCVLALGKLPYLTRLTLFSVVIIGGRMSFPANSYPQLNLLELHYLHELEEWEVEDGALCNLQHLEVHKCEKLKKLPRGLPQSVHIDCYQPCIRGVENYNVSCPWFKPEEAESCFIGKYYWQLH